MPTYYAEFAFTGKRVVRIDADSNEDALRVAKATMDSPHGPSSGLTVESYWSNFDAPRLVDDFSTRVRKQSEEIERRCEEVRDRAAALKNAYVSDKTPSIRQDQSGDGSSIYYFCVPITGQAVLQISAEGEEQALAAAQSATFSLMPRFDKPLISYSYEKGQPKMVRADLT